MDSALLEVKDLSVSFAQTRVVDDLSFSLYPGQTYALLGESGSGKSMTAQAMMGILPTNAEVSRESQILLKNQDCLDLSERDMRQIRGSRIAMIFQEPMTALNPVLTIGQQLRQPRTRAIALLTQVEIPRPDEIISAYPHQLSGGMKQRVVIAMAIAQSPEILIADEPTTALDVTIQAQILKLLKNLQTQNNMALLLITHDFGVAAYMANDVGVMRQGKLVETAPAAQFFKAPQHPYSQSLFAALPSLDKRPDTPPITAPAILNLNDFSVSYKNFNAVKDVSLEIRSGQIVALVGESGCGKTSLAKALLNLTPATAQTAKFSELNLINPKRKTLRKLRRAIQIVFQDPYASLNPRMRIKEILSEGRKLSGQELSGLLQQVGMPESSLAKYPHEFSGGQRQRLCIARALAVKPQLLICDEPTSALDVSVQAQLLDLLKKIQQEAGMSYLLITHDLAVVAYLADYVYVMNQGEIVEQGETRQLLTQPQHPYTRQLLSACLSL